MRITLELNKEESSAIAQMLDTFGYKHNLEEFSRKVDSRGPIKVRHYGDSGSYTGIAEFTPGFITDICETVSTYAPQLKHIVIMCKSIMETVKSLASGMGKEFVKISRRYSGTHAPESREEFLGGFTVPHNDEHRYYRHPA